MPEPNPPDPFDAPQPSTSTTMTHITKKKRVDEEPAPADLGLKPVQLQRRRVWRACESCRRKKIKCDGNEPTCSQCSASKSQCTWLQTKDRAALSRHYVQELEARLLHMESLFQQVAPILEQYGDTAGIDLSAIPPPITSTPTPSPGHRPQVSQSSIQLTNGSPPQMGDIDRPIKVEDDVSESFGQLALDEHGHLHWIGGSSTMSLIQSFRAMTSNPLHRVSPMEDDPLAPGPSVNKLYFPASVFFGKVHALPRPEEVEYPDRDLADKLVDAYFAKFHFLMPVIDKPSFMHEYTYLMDHTKEVQLARRRTAFIALVCAVFAVAARFVDDPRLSKFENLDDAGMGMVYYERALILHYISHASSQVEHVQCFLLLSSFLCSVNCLPQAWLLIGQAVRTAQDIGLHRSPRRLTTLNPIERETRRKIWWGVYTLDRMLALALGRPLAIEDSDCDVELPVDIDDTLLPEYFSGAASPQGPSLMRGFIELTVLYRIGGQVLRQVYALDKCRDHLEPERRAELARAVENLDGRLTRWCDELPAQFKSQPRNEKEVSMGAVLCSHYYTILTTLHRNFLPLKRDQAVSPKSTTKALMTARACVRLAPSIKNVVPPCHHLAFFIQNLFSSAVIILLYAMHCTDPAASASAMEEVNSCLSVLQTWEGHWPGARKCKELLEDLTTTARQASQAPQNSQARSNGVPSPASSVMSDGWGTTPLPMPVSERLMKGHPRRNRSRDVRSDARMSPHGSPSSAQQFRADPQRARSTSRKRPHDDDFLDGSSQYAGGLPSSYPGRPSLLSTHSSPASANSHPSPSPAQLDFPAEAHPPRLMTSNSYGPIGIPVNPQSPGVGTPSGQQRFDYEFGLSQSPSERWGLPPPTPAGDANGLKFFPGGPASAASGASMATQYGFAQPQSPAVDAGFGYPAYDTGAGVNADLALFNGSGLPFRGLDYIKNFNPANQAPAYMADGNASWQNLDPGVFGYDPEIPFTFGEMGADGSQEWQQ